MKKIGWLEDFLGPLEKKAKEILKTQSNIKEDFQFKKLNEEKGITRFQANPKYQSAGDLLKQTQSFKEFILKNGTPRDVIYKLTWILGIAYDMGWPVPSQYIIGRSKGGKAPKKAEGFVLACQYALRECKGASVMFIWRFLKRRCLKDTQLSFGGHDIEFDESGNKFLEINRKGKIRSFSYITFQRYIRDLKNNDTSK